MLFDFCFRLFVTLVLLAIFVLSEAVVARACVFFFDEKTASRSAFIFCNACLVLSAAISVFIV